jgi:hypothetical protein
MWNMKCVIIVVIAAATGIVTKGLKKNLESKPGKHQQIHYKRQLYLAHDTFVIQKILQSEF